MSRISDEFFDALDERVLDILDQPGDNVRDLLVEMEGDRLHILGLEAEIKRLNQLSIDLRACMFEARHKWGLEQDKNERLRDVVKFLACGFACVHYPDQDRDHPGIQYPDCVDPEVECCVADALAALDDPPGTWVDVPDNRIGKLILDEEDTDA